MPPVAAATESTCVASDGSPDGTSRLPCSVALGPGVTLSYGVDGDVLRTSLRCDSCDGWVAIANQKHYVSLYTCGYHHIEDFKNAYPKVRTGKGCINFREKDELPLDALADVVRHAIEHPHL